VRISDLLMRFHRASSMLDGHPREYKLVLHDEARQDIAVQSWLSVPAMDSVAFDHGSRTTLVRGAGARLPLLVWGPGVDIEQEAYKWVEQTRLVTARVSWRTSEHTAMRGLVVDQAMLADDNTLRSFPRRCSTNRAQTRPRHSSASSTAQSSSVVIPLGVYALP
jgi:hypothetical protein